MNKSEIHNQLTSITFNGHNYLSLARAVTIALGGRSKSSHINENEIPLDFKDPKFSDWQASDNLVMSWIFNSMDPQIYEIFAYSETAKALWTSLKEMYGQSENASRVFELQQELSHMEQVTGQPFIDHLGNMKRKWDKLRQYRPSAPTIDIYIQCEEQDRIFLLLASLRPEYEDLRRQILMSTNLPSFASVCATIHREETRRRVMHSNPKSGGESFESFANTMSSTPQNNRSSSSFNYRHGGKT
ncbi:UBN2_3 domain-containing protein [Cephalotus follicularis]|uniref:UBN2_3 domain-containing protein n=1 Tax=Cephalotus follicularis TaxID=3775 RepID=A0A1Q3BQ56_CEPFO|nr:UBN2_3 domain-containing protein [Cephalotus follicularis]